MTNRLPSRHQTQLPGASAVGDTEEDYGLIRPSLIKQLRSILDQYPDDGQILKELVQNAEDAGATEVRFMLDDNDHPTHRLHHPDMAQFQGPALYAYNNALFEDKDWTGIRMLQDSVKEKDPMKVGRFGLGFKSVLHMTDLPSVMSGDRLFVIDPHERYFQYKGDKTSGYSWHLKQKKASMRQISDQFEPYKSVFGCSKETFDCGYYNGTLFRFPLRNDPSELSQTVYSIKRVEELLRSFQGDAPCLMLFLKNLESVKLFRRSKGQKEPQLLYEVRIAPDCIKYIRQKRKDFVTRCRSEENQQGTTLTYLVFVETLRYDDTGNVDRQVYKWLINEYKAGTNVSVQLQELQKDPSLSLVPLVGVAMAINNPDMIKKTTEHSKDDSDNNPDSADNSPESADNSSQSADLSNLGQVFCFLPLPVEQKTSTGLPVHVNGYFAISQNRRHLKWPTAGQNVKSDKSVYWNQCLIRELLPVSYSQLLLQAIQISQQNKDLISPRDVYHAIPDLMCVDEKWQIFLEPLFNRIFKYSIIQTEADGGKWVGVEEAIFDCLKEDKETLRTITDVCLRSSVNITKVPMHILHALGAFSQHSLEIVSPSGVRSVLRSKPACYTTLEKADKLRLLLYVLKDEDFQDLQGIGLLPCADGSFVPFTGPSIQAVYIPTHDIPRELFPGLEKYLITDDLEDLLKHKLTKLANEGVSQLRYVDKQITAKLITKVVPSDWYRKDFVTVDETSSVSTAWLETLWNYLRKQYPRDVSAFLELPILPLNSGPSMKLVPLSLSSPCVMRSAMGVGLEEGLLKVLSIFGVHVVDVLPDYIQSHAAVLGNFIKLPMKEDVVEVLYHSHKMAEKKQNMFETLRLKASPGEKEALINVLAGLKLHNLAKPIVGFLRKLPVFMSTHSTDESPDFVSVEEVSKGLDLRNLPCKISKKFININSESVEKACSLLGVTLVDKAEAFREHIFKDIKQGLSDPNTVDTVMGFVFSNFTQYAQDPSFMEELSGVPFVRCGGQHLRKPAELFDPDDKLLAEMFDGESAVFPTEKYAEAETLIYLKKLGLKTSKTLLGKDLLEYMFRLEDISKEQHVIKKSKAFLNLLGERSNLLWEDTQGKLLLEWASDIAWVPVLQDKPVIFPQGLRWHADVYTRKPSEITHSDNTPLVGSVKSVIDGKIHPSLMDGFGWNQTPQIIDVVSHLQEIVKSFLPQEKAKVLTLLTSIYDFFMQMDIKDVESAITQQKLTTWVWYGDGFISPSCVLAAKLPIDLSPYIYSLPSEMKQFVSMFTGLGVKEQCDTGILVKVLAKIPPAKTGGSDTERNLQMAIDILNYISDQDIPENIVKHILVPTQIQVASGFDMLPICSCTYCDVEWIRQGFDLMEFDEQDGIVFIHSNLPVSTASKLGIPTLMSRMLHAEELAITGFGQGEPLTCRLKQLLEDYSDGLAIFKEMIQNADDAGATEVNFLFDERQNEDCKKYLIDEGMKECQGPALWVHNNSVFTNQDFINITKLGGATKEQEPEKIGRFGLGFNSVYNITDVPSFVSRNNIVIFDPHTTHLGKGIKDRSRPGIKIDMTKNKTLLRKLSDQFQPYQDIFNCDVQPDKGGCYNGTLFRLPLRTKLQAAKSEISGLHYDREEMISLLNLMIKHSHNLLLFTQNLQTVGLFHIPPNGDSSAVKRVFTLEKNIVNILREQAVIPKSMKKDPPVPGTRLAFLAASSQYIKHTSKPMTSRLVTVPQVPQSTVVIGTSSKMDESALNLTTEEKLSDKYWLVSGCVGQERSKKLSVASKGLLVPVGGIAINLMKVDDGFVPRHILNAPSKALAFCFLPLPVVTGLPVHINGTFALESSRRHLSQRTEDDKEDRKADWNEALLEDAVTHGYLQALSDLKKVLPPNEEVNFYSIWPTFHSSEPYFQPLVNSFYKNLSSLMQTPLCCRNGVIIALGNAVFLNMNDKMSTKMIQHAIEAFSDCAEGYHVLTPPKSVIESFEQAGYHNILADKHYDIHRFYQEIFLPNIAKLESTNRDPLLVFALQQNDKYLNQLLEHTECIPASPAGKTLKKICDLVHPTALASRLYTAEDGCFPFGDVYSDGNVLGHLQRLGLKVNDVSWADLIERAKTLQNTMIHDESVGKKRFHNVMAFIDRKLLQTSNYVKSSTGPKEVIPEDDKEVSTARDILREISFLPALKKPNHYPITWAGEKNNSEELFCACDLYPKEARYLVSATQLIADETNMTPRTKLFLDFSKNEVTIQQVMTQLEHVLVVDLNFFKDGKEYEELQKSVFSIYSYIQDKLAVGDEMAEELCNILHDRPCILAGNQFHAPKQLALNFPYDCSPYLYSLPQDVVRRFQPLMTKLKVKENFSTKDYVEVLQKIHSESGDKRLDERQLDISVRMTSQLNNSMKSTGIAAEDVVETYGEIYIPNARNILQPSRTLCYNDCPWITETQVMNFTHPDITFNTSACLGVKTKRQEALSKHAKGIPFGQKERLTNSLKRILSTYPCDHEIFKELIQNADDAQATEIHFIRDPRHHSEEHVFENSWKPLQGPALCVYNNRSFTLEDLEGIQRLGEGSKNRDPSKTGQYGIGFSSVYHLTDAPSVLTDTKDIGKTLCVFDPHCYYVPGATPAEPGMRYENVQQLEKAFPDVFSCYLPTELDVKDSTVLRFPLRTLSMAENSKISKQHITMSRLHAMLEKLKSEAFDILLFTNYLEEIKVSDIDPLTGELANTYTVKIILSEKQKLMRCQLAQEVKDIGKAMKTDSSSFSSHEHKEYGYIVYVVDNMGRQEKWCIAQTLGFNKDLNIPEVVTKAFIEGNLALMPRGGAACLLEERLNGQTENSNRKMKAFCFLPLPIQTDLPVHINAHFALGHENRRHLWNKDTTDDYRTAWNNLLCSSVIAEAYVSLLKSIRLNGLQAQITENSSIVTCSRHLLDSCIATYMSCFPMFSDMSPEWNNLVKNVYLTIANTRASVLPAIQEHILCREEQQIHGTQWCVKWFPPVGDGSEKAFFSKPEEQPIDQAHQRSLLSRFRNMFKVSSQKPTKSEDQILKDVLVECGMKLLDAPPALIDNFVKCGIQIHFMSPAGVLLFLRSYTADEPICQLGKLPQLLTQTPFRDEKTLCIILKYCKKDEDFLYKLGGVPLLLTEDGMLRVFDEEQAVYLSQYPDLLHERSDLFIKKSLVSSVFEEVDFTTCCVMKKLTIPELGGILQDKLSVEKFCCEDGKPMEWKKGYGELPGEIWLKRFWTFVKDETKPKHSDHVEVTSTPTTPGLDHMELLSPLLKWRLLPAKASPKSFLFPLGNATDVIYHTQVDYKWYGVRDVLRKLHLPELDVSAINMDSSYNSEIAKSLVTTLDKPKAVLNILSSKFQHDATKPDITKEEAERLLAYFVHHIQELNEETCASQLCALPIYTTIYGDLISLINCVVYTLPAKIPTQGIDIWQSRSGTVFLERKAEFVALYNMLGCASISVLDVYCKFIFQHLEYFPEDDRMIHLYHVYNKYIKNDATHQNELTAEEKENLQHTMKDLPFIPDGSGELQPASEFYDPENVVFRVMLPVDKFPPAPTGNLFKESEWYTFLGKLGLVREMNKDMFVSFANEIASEGHLHDKNAALAKSKVLVEHLFDMSASSRESIMPEISKIKFVAQGTVPRQLTLLRPQYGDVGTDILHFASFRDSISTDFEKLVWTQATVLPEWADPSKLHHLSYDQKISIMKGLEIQQVPRLNLVVQNLLEIARYINDSSDLPDVTRTIKSVFKEIYRFLGDNIGGDQDIIDTLVKEPTVIVQGGTLLVKANQTVVSFYEGDEIRPYLYRVPVDFGEFVNFFKLLGASERVTVNQYATVLESIKKEHGVNKLTPNVTAKVFKTMKGLMHTLETCSPASRDVSVAVLYLLSESGHLVDAHKLVFNDAPSFYDRVRDFGMQFIVDPRDFGVKSRHVEDILMMLPQRIRPGMLSAYVKEELMEHCKKSVTQSGLAKTLNQRVQSEGFLSAVARLVRHDAQKTGQKLDDVSMFDILDRLSTIHVFGVQRVTTHLTFKDKHIDGSEVGKACYVEKIQGANSDLCQWNLYIQQDSTLGQDLLVPLAEIINKILSGLLRDSVLYLLPILSCSANEISSKLDSLNIRLDRNQPANRKSLLPELGSNVDESLRTQLKWGEVVFEVGEYVGFKLDERSPVIHARVREEVMSPEDNRVYLLETSQGQDSVIAQAPQMFKYERH